MSWFVEAFTTSVGKKLIMAFTGLFFLLFLLVHLAGNLTLYAGKETFLSYVAHLHSFEVLLSVAEVILLVLAVLHVGTGTVLFVQNRRARPVRYAMDKPGGGRTVSSITMPYTGFVILAFLVLHLSQLHFIGPDSNIYKVLVKRLSDPLWAFVYTIVVLIVALHVRHGFFSIFQTIGANHPKYMPAVRVLAVAYAIVIAFGFGLIPAYIVYSI